MTFRGYNHFKRKHGERNHLAKLKRKGGTPQGKGFDARPKGGRENVVMSSRTKGGDGQSGVSKKEARYLNIPARKTGIPGGRPGHRIKLKKKKRKKLDLNK